jgi:hypothetical protein
MSGDSFPLSGELIGGAAAYRWIAEAMGASGERVDLCSAFVRSEALLPLLDRLPTSKSQSRRLLVRWKIGDLLAGASDLKTFHAAVSRGFQVYVRLDFHGKVYCLPPRGLVVGSANATASGFQLSQSRGNEEVCTVLNCSPGSLSVVDSLFRKATLVDEALYERLVNAVDRVFGQSETAPEWPQDILAIIAPPPPSTLFVDQCMWSGPATQTELAMLAGKSWEHDLSLLGLAPRPDLSAYRLALRDAPMFRWLVGALQARGGSAYFGELSAALHAALLDDPGPRRHAVKELLQNTLKWIETCSIAEIEVDRPNYSQRVSLRAREQP